MDVVLGEITAVLRGEGGRLPDPLPFRDFVAQARLGVPREEHERYFAGLLGDVTEPTAPFGLLDVRGDGTDAAQARLAVDAGPGGAAAGAGAGGGGEPGDAVPPGVRRGCWRWRPGVRTWCSARCCSAGCRPGAGADRIPGPFMNTLPVRVDTGAAGVAGAVAAMQAAAGRAAGARARPAGAGAAGQRRGGARAAVHLDPELPPQPRPGGRSSRAGGGLAGIRVLFGRDRTNYPLTVSVDDTGTGFGFTVDAVAPADPAQVCALLHTAAASLVTALEADPATPLRAVQVLGAAERAQVLAGWNDTGGGGAGGDAGGVVRGAGGPVPGCGGGGVRGRRW